MTRWWVLFPPTWLPHTGGSGLETLLLRYPFLERVIHFLSAMGGGVGRWHWTSLANPHQRKWTLPGRSLPAVGAAHSKCLEKVLSLCCELGQKLFCQFYFKVPPGARGQLGAHWHHPWLSSLPPIFSLALLFLTLLRAQSFAYYRTPAPGLLNSDFWRCVSSGLHSEHRTDGQIGLQLKYTQWLGWKWLP